MEISLYRNRNWGRVEEEIGDSPQLFICCCEEGSDAAITLKKEITGRA
jgi:hypothetical protein